MRKLFMVIGMLAVLASPAYARQRIWGFCEIGGVTLHVGGLPPIAQEVQGSWPGCTISVFYTATSNLATIYADNNGTALGNPFTADPNTGYWFFYITDSRIDVRISGAGIPTPFTFGDVLAFDFADLPGCLTSIYLPSTAGADIGAQINAAAASGVCPEIWVNVPGNLSTPLSLPANTTVRFWVPVTWTASTSALLSGDQILGDGPNAVITYSPGTPQPIFSGNTQSGIVVKGLNVTASTPNAGTDVLFYCTYCNSPTISGNNVTGMDLAHVGDEGPLGGYSAITDANSSHKVLIEDNVLDESGISGGSGSSIQVRFGVEVGVHNNIVLSGTIYFWGGDNCGATRAENNTPSGSCSNWQFARKTQHISATGNVGYKTILWGASMQDFTFSGNVMAYGGDVCLDAEASISGTISGNTAWDCGTAGISGFYGDQSVTWIGNTVGIDQYSTATYPAANGSALGWLTTDISSQGRDLLMTGNNFNCYVPNGICGLYLFGQADAGGLTVTNNHFYNTLINAQYVGPSTDLSGNQFHFTSSPTPPQTAIYVSNFNPPANGQNPIIAIKQNRFENDGTMPAGSYAIQLHNESSGKTVQTYVQGNVFGGINPFPIDAYFDGTDGGMSVYLTGNSFAGGVVNGTNTATLYFDKTNTVEILSNSYAPFPNGATPPTTNSYWAGSYYWNSAPTNGILGWTCVAPATDACYSGAGQAMWMPERVGDIVYGVPSNVVATSATPVTIFTTPLIPSDSVVYECKLFYTSNNASNAPTFEVTSPPGSSCNVAAIFPAGGSTLLQGANIAAEACGYAYLTGAVSASYTYTGEIYGSVIDSNTTGGNLVVTVQSSGSYTTTVLTGSVCTVKRD